MSKMRQWWYPSENISYHRREWCLASYSMSEILNKFSPKVQMLAYTKDNNIHVVINWVPEAHLKRFSQAVHTQFHGREVHSVHFIPSCVNSQLHHCSNSNMGLYWIATGGEDGTVRLTRYTSKGGDKINLSMPLEEHVGGSAVRSVTCVSEIYPLYSKPEYHTKQDASSMNKDAPLLLFSAGAKQVLTCWLLKWKNHTSGFHNDSLIENSVDCSHEVEVDNSMISSQWLTSYMQPRINKTSRKASMTNQLEKVTNAELGKVLPAVIREDAKQGGMNTSRESSVCIDEIEDDWRYLAVTAFLVQPPDTRLTICFVVMSCSNATLSLQALVLPKRIWYEVAVLEHEPAPVLALQHAIIPFHLPDKATDTYQNTYLAFSGTTTGTVSVWDLTYLVNDFCHKATNQNPGDPKMALKRPQTGRGSQGGRRWRISRQKHEFQIGLTKKSKIEESGINQEMENNTANSVTEENSQDSNPSENTSTGQFAETRNYLEQCQMHLPTTDLVDDTENPVSKVEKGAEVATAHPIHVFHNVHQSGVNCLHVSRLNNKGMQEMHNFNFNYCIVSGGDDQALHVACFCLHLLEQEKEHAAKVESNPYIYSGISSSFASSKQKYDSLNIKVSESHKGDFKSAEISKYVFKCIDQQRVKSAHNSSVEGVWTDGHWVFSTGLDQRVRCWNLMFSNSCCSLKECCNSIVSVPQPETLHATLDHQRNCYKIAIAGRGMQIIEFLT